MRLTAAEADAGQRLDAFLAPHLDSRTAAVKAIASGRVTVDGSAARKSHLIQPGELIEVAIEIAPEPADSVAEPDSIPLAFSDDDLIVIDKPPGLVAHPAPGHREGTVSQIMAPLTGGGDDGRQGVVHRLDRDTSGLMILARNEAAHRRLRQLIDDREVKRVYLALVSGHPPTSEGTIDAPIGRDRRHRTRVSTSTDSPREAVTHFRVVESLPAASLLELTLETGRTHQIRAHLEAIGFPVEGDPEYGPPGPARYGLKRQFLHAERLEFEHPVSGAATVVESPLPEDLAAALTAARRG